MRLNNAAKTLLLLCDIERKLKRNLIDKDEIMEIIDRAKDGAKKSAKEITLLREKEEYDCAVKTLVPSRIDKQLRAMANAADISISALVREFIQNGLEDQ